MYDLEELIGSGIQSPYRRLGGKSRLKIKILTFFPKNYETMDYIEPFFGGGSIYFYKEPSKKEVINDLDKNMFALMNGFKKYDGFKISEDINDTYNKNFFDKLLDLKPKSGYDKFIRILLLVKLSFFGNARGFAGNPTIEIKIKSNYQDKYKERLKDTIILNQDYKEVIKKYDNKNAFFYIDPPYSMSKDSKYYDDKSIDINELYDLLKNIKGKFLLSYDNDKTAKDLFKDFDIVLVKTLYSQTPQIENREKIELLIKNY